MTWKTIKGELETSTEKKNWNVGGPCQNTLRSLVVGVVFVTHEKRELFFLPFFSIWNSLRGYWMGVRPSKKKRKKKVSSSFISVLFTWPFCVCLRVVSFSLCWTNTGQSSLSLLAGVRAQCVYVYCSVWRRAVVGWAQQERREPRQMDLSHRSWENYTGYLLVKRRRRSISLGRRVCTHLFQHQKASTLHLSILFLPFVAADINQQRIYIYIYIYLKV